MTAARFAGLAALLATTLGIAPGAFAADLLQTWQQALGNDPIYTAARYSRDAGQEKITQGRAGLLPNLGANGAYNRAISGNGSTNNYTVALTQPLFRLANWEAFQQGKLQAASSEVQFSLAQQDLMLRVAQAYFDVLAAQDAQSFLDAQMTAIEQQLASAKRNFDIGTSTITDTNEAQARYDLARAQRIGANNDLELAQTRLRQIIGTPPGALAVLRTDVALKLPEPATIEPWTAAAEQQNFNVVTQQLQLEIARRDIKRQRAGHYPTLDLVASRNKQSQITGDNNPFTNFSSTTNAVGVQWNIPIFSGFAVDSQVTQAVALSEKARYDLENAQRTAVQNARQAYLGVVNGLAQVDAYQAAERSSLSSLKSNQLGYQVGVRINIDVLNAQQQLFSTRRDLAKARYDTLQNGLKLKAAAGTLREEDLAQINQLLTAPAN